MADAPRTFLPKAPDNWHYEITLRADSGASVSIYPEAGQWVATGHSIALAATFPSLREALQTATDTVRRWESAQAKFAEAQAALMALMPDANVPETPGFAQAREDFDAQPIRDA